MKAFHLLFIMQILSGRSSGLREDGKVGNRDTAAGDPPGLRDQVSISANNYQSPKASQSPHSFRCAKLRACQLNHRCSLMSFSFFCSKMNR